MISFVFINFLFFSEHTPAGRSKTRQIYMDIVLKIYEIDKSVI